MFGIVPAKDDIGLEVILLEEKTEGSAGLRLGIGGGGVSPKLAEPLGAESSQPRA